MLIKIILYSIFIKSIQSDIPISVDEYNSLPPIYHLDSDEKCYKENKYYCTVKANLEPNDSENPSKAWENMQTLTNLPNFFNHHELLHGICFEDFCKGFHLFNSTNFNETLEDCYAKKYQDMDLKASVVRFDCKRSRKNYDVNQIDVLLLIAFVSYVNFVLFATFYEYSLNNSNQKNSIKVEGNKYVLCFSLIKNWNRIKRSSQTSNTDIMSYIQGLRFYNTVIIIVFHTLLSYFVIYADNPSYFEKIDDNPVKYLVKNSFLFLVQPFFLLSAFFLSSSAFKKLGHLKILSIKHLFVLLLNRYLRLIPPLLVGILLSSTVWFLKFLFVGPINDMFCTTERDNCKNNWWANLLFINNQYDVQNMCYLLSWYVAADFQLYAFSLILLALIWKYKNHMKLILFIPFISGIIIRFITNYAYNFQVIYRVYPDRFKDNAFRDHELGHNYMFTYLQLPTYIVGIYMGYIFHKYKNQRIFGNVLMKTVFWLSAFGLPSLVLLLTTGHNYSKITTALIASVLNPMLSLGIGVLILGMRENLAQFVKRILEWKVATNLASFCYSTYIIQYNIILQRTCSQLKLAFVSDTLIALSCVRDIILSFFCGFLVYIAVEMPAFSLQKMLIPQVEDLDKIKEKRSD